MQIKSLHGNIYKLYAYSRKQECLDAYRKKYEEIVKVWDNLKAAGVHADKLAALAGFSRPTYYRAKHVLKNLAQGKRPPSKRPRRVNKPRWGESEKQQVLAIRRENPTYGKAKIAIILKRDNGLNLSESTVGRILAQLKKKGLITRSSSAMRGRKKRYFKGHATRWHYKDYHSMVMGERVQIDHMSATKNGVSVKHFQAWDRKSKFLHAQAYGNATSRSAKKFLLELIERLPFALISIQVDGGSEFMGEFETACEELKIPLIVLPPAKPAYNGGVERGNRTFREEFYEQARFQADSLGAIRNELQAAVTKYNTYRPHFALDGLTPMEYITQLCQQEAA